MDLFYPELERNFREIKPTEMDQNFISQISRKWALLLARNNKGRPNAMTISWGNIGFLWNIPVTTVYVREQRHTFKFIEESQRVTLNFFSDEHKNVLRYFGRVSGREEDKIHNTTIKYSEDENNIGYFEEAEMVIVGRKIYAEMLNKDSFIDTSLLDHYENDSLHKAYTLAIEKIYIKK